MICSPVANQAINVAVDLHDHLHGLQLADKCDGIEDLEIDILIHPPNPCRQKEQHQFCGIMGSLGLSIPSELTSSILVNGMAKRGHNPLSIYGS